MRKVSSAAGAVIVVAALGATAAGCGQISMLKAKMAFKDANTLYAGENWESAARRYEEAVAEGCTDAGCQPAEIAYSYFFLGNSYDNMYRPNRKDDAANQAVLKRAADNYQKAAEVSPDEIYRRRALQYLVALHGADKLNDPAGAEPIVQRLIQLDPEDPTNYYQLAKLYEDAGDFERAEAQLLKAKEVRPNDPDVYAQLARFYEARGDFDKQIQALTERAEKSPDSPEAQHTIAATYWAKACVDERAECVGGAPKSRAIKAEYIKAGLQAADKAIALRDDYIDALVFKGLLLRSQALLEPGRQAELLGEANRLSDRANEIRKRRQGEAPQAASQS
jgi:tetratricopeptide (TPR) repeat protein